MDALNTFTDHAHLADQTLWQDLEAAEGKEAILSSPFAATPPEMPLTMPAQNLGRYDRSQRRSWQKNRPQFWVWLARLIVFGGGLALTAYGAWQMYQVVSLGGVTPLEWVLLVLFVANFSWIALAFTGSIVGFIWLFVRPPADTPTPKTLREKTVVVMPIYNEAPARVFGAMQAIFEDVEATGLGQAFDWFFLSDTTDPDIFIAEEQAFIAMRERLASKFGSAPRLYYRHRPKNTARKAGNIEDFVTRWGGLYAHMVVLDADSLMTGHAIVTLAATMEADPDSGIIQTLPLIVNRNTLFARLQQFAARIYGPVIAAGVAAWMGRDGNYWGHNAIIRIKAFAGHCGLPTLKGRPPFGGLILSHDFVEAALIRRAGYSVYMLPTLDGSYEESPPSLIDLSARDRRWCQGNLQHLRVIGSAGFHLASRQHFATGIMAYVASPLWMAQLIIGIILVIQASYIRPEYFTNQFTLFPTWPVFDAKRSLELFTLTMAILLAPKFLGLILALTQGKTRRGSGGALPLLISTFFEIIFSALLAPIMMLIQTGHVMHFAFGFDTGWDPQRRDDGSIPFKAIVRRHRSHVVMGVVTLIAGYMISPSLIAWMSPTIVGLLLAIVLSWSTGLLGLGLALRRVGLLLTPEEHDKPKVVERGNVLGEELAAASGHVSNALTVVHNDARFRAFHSAFLSLGPKRPRGQITPEWALAQAKLGEAASLEEAVKWLQPKERLAAVQDPTLIARVAELPKKT
ncbi:glucans biosynthesis glucosyltransferase MdoH [Beijerinckia indica]|uniref:Glucans biosynthesis glucosyltransferase H n=1 Tax=Beijerinckia indica subsp. indica (strain ATCC 9039 / DSM 1715 / NCIMB 8712) TaxID=395963 RepID=B2IDJ7_BEII9|nr:glucans biosynthesis glucosyltransferase MdoH [Beijerinckia indica]ACB95433.1 glycosyl transferase family 2 [Beijerinckia indica subsp. indica ATCC 9039]